MKRLQIAFIITAIAFLSVSTFASAQIDQGDVELNLSFALSNNGEVKIESDSGEESVISESFTQTVFSLWLGYFLKKEHEIAPQFALWRIDDGDESLTVFRFALSYFYNIMLESNEKIVPFFGGGAGVTLTSIGDEDDKNESGTDPGFNFGGGLRAFVTENASINFQYFYSRLSTDLMGGLEERVWMNNHQVSAGISIFLP